MLVLATIINHNLQEVSDHLEGDAVLALVCADDLKHVAALLGIGGLACKVVCCGDELPRRAAALRGVGKCARTVALNRLMVPAGGYQEVASNAQRLKGEFTQWLNPELCLGQLGKAMHNQEEVGLSACVGIKASKAAGSFVACSGEPRAAPVRGASSVSGRRLLVEGWGE